MVKLRNSEQMGEKSALLFALSCFAILANFAILSWINLSCNRGGAMGEKRSWRQKIKQHSVATVLIALLAVIIILIILSILGYIFNWGWTGVNHGCQVGRIAA